MTAHRLRNDIAATEAAHHAAITPETLRRIEAAHRPQDTYTLKVLAAYCHATGYRLHNITPNHDPEPHPDAAPSDVAAALRHIGTLLIDNNHQLDIEHAARTLNTTIPTIHTVIHNLAHLLQPLGITIAWPTSTRIALIKNPDSTDTSHTYTDTRPPPDNINIDQATRLWRARRA